jgi:hypothetical protein
VRCAVSVDVISNLVIVPNGDPSEVLVARNQVEICSVGRESLSVVIQGCNLFVGLRNTADTVAPTIIPLGILIYVVTEMNDVVYGILM